MYHQSIRKFIQLYSPNPFSLYKWIFGYIPPAQDGEMEMGD